MSVPAAPFKAIVGSGQKITVPNGSSSAAASCTAFGVNTYAIAISLAYAATATGALVAISPAGANAATATADILIKTTDFPVVLGCAPGDKLRVYGLAAGTLYLTEMTH